MLDPPGVASARIERLDPGDDVALIGEVDGDGAIEVVLRGPDHAVRVLRLRGMRTPDVVLEAAAVRPDVCGP